jgi:hypothetical protein
VFSEWRGNDLHISWISVTSWQIVMHPWNSSCQDPGDHVLISVEKISLGRMLALLSHERLMEMVLACCLVGGSEAAATTASRRA